MKGCFLPITYWLMFTRTKGEICGKIGARSFWAQCLHASWFPCKKPHNLLRVTVLKFAATQRLLSGREGWGKEVCISPYFLRLVPASAFATAEQNMFHSSMTTFMQVNENISYLNEILLHVFGPICVQSIYFNCHKWVSYLRKNMLANLSILFICSALILQFSRQ